MPDPAHPSAKVLSDFGLGKLPRDAADDVAAHLAGCGECQEKLAGQPPDSFVARLRVAGPKSNTSLPRGKRPPALPGAAAPTSPPVHHDGGVSCDRPAELASLSKFQVLGKLGEGGMGSVWKARHAFLGSVVAVKVLTEAGLGDEEARHRFLVEMRAAGRLDHPNIVRALDAEQIAGVPYLVMEYVEGISLDKLVTQNGAPPVGLACRYAQQAALGLQHAHEKGMVHRDIKPGNLILASDGTVKLLDFGLARLREDEPGDRRTRLQVFMGTADYVAPEQALNARDADARSDIYSLGSTLYFLLSGRPPFTGETAQDVAAAHLTEEPPPLDDIPEGLWAVIGKMLAKDRDQRYQTPREVVEALAPFASRLDSATVPPLPPPLPRPRWPRPRLAVALAGAAALAIVLSAVLLLPARRPPAKFDPLFNGKDLTGWETHPDSATKWEVKDGLLVCEGRGPSFLFTTRDDYENVHLRARVRLRKGGNSGLFVRKVYNTRSQEGYQAEVFTESDGTPRAGRIAVAGALLTPADDSVPLGEWVSLEFILDGYRLETKVNGRVAASALDPARRYARGRIAVELARDSSRVEFSQIDVLELPAPPQLLRNPGCEEEPTDGKVPGWEVVEGNWAPRSADPAPQQGKAYFSPGECQRGELRQLVDLSGHAQEIDGGRLGLTFEGYVATRPPGRSDTSQVIIDYVGAARERLASYNSGPVASEDGWQKLHDSRLVPKGTRAALVRLISVRRHGESNDGFFDGLWLKADVVRPLN